MAATVELTRINGARIIAETPVVKDADDHKHIMLFVAACRDSYGYEYVVSTMRLGDHHWGQGHYFRNIFDALEFYKSRGGE